MQKQSSAEYQFNVRKPLATIVSLLAREKKNLIPAGLFFIIKNSPSWGFPIITAHIINAVTYILQNPADKTRWMHSIIVNLCVFAALAVQNIPSHTAFVYFLAKGIRSIEADMRLSIIRRLQQLSVSFQDKTPSGVIQSKILRDVESIRNVIMVLMNNYLSAITSCILAFVMTLQKVPIMAVLYSVTIPLVWLLMKIFRRRVNESNSRLRHDMEQMNADVAEMIAMLPVSKAHGVEDSEIRKMSQEFGIIFRNGLKLDTISAVFGSANWVAFQLLQAGCLLFTIPLALNGVIDTGDIILYQGFFSLVLGSVTAVINTYPDMLRGMEAVRSIGEILDSKELDYNEGKTRLADVSGCVSFNNIRFSYSAEKGIALKDVNFSVKQGENVAFVGESGSGKSTVIQLILGLRHPQRGTVTVDGHDLTQIDLRSYRQRISIVPQTVVLFSGTIADNISYGLPHVSFSRLKEAAEAANALEFIEKLPHGFDTIIDGTGNSLSGGQRQRIAIARAFIRDPRILILDEATSALDASSEQLVQAAVDTLIKNRTCFIVAHRLSTVRRADRIFVMKAGRIVEEGSYDHLLQAGGEFTRLHSLQS